MKKQTNLKVIISIEEMELLIEKMKQNKGMEPAMSNFVMLSLCEDSDYRCGLRIDTTKQGEQFSGYQDGSSMSVSFMK
jgi:hypothetical protein